MFTRKALISETRKSQIHLVRLQAVLNRPSGEAGNTNMPTIPAIPAYIAAQVLQTKMCHKN